LEVRVKAEGELKIITAKPSRDGDKTLGSKKIKYRERDQAVSLGSCHQKMGRKKEGAPGGGHSQRPVHRE